MTLLHTLEKYTHTHIKLLNVALIEWLHVTLRAPYHLSGAAPNTL